VRGVTLPLNVLFCITIIGGEQERGLEQQLSWIDPKFFHLFKNLTSKSFISAHRSIAINTDRTGAQTLKNRLDQINT